VKEYVMAHFSAYYKVPQIMNEKRAQAIVCDAEVVVQIRAARTGHNLPDAWDDIPRQKKPRTWKAYRTTQYKYA
jgi:hypothetical protein